MTKWIHDQLPVMFEMDRMDEDDLPECYEVFEKKKYKEVNGEFSIDKVAHAVRPLTGSELNAVLDNTESAISFEEGRLIGTDVLAHRLWTHWSKHIAEEEDISDERLERWKENWVPFEDLRDEIREIDRRLVNKYASEKPDYE